MAASDQQRFQQLAALFDQALTITEGAERQAFVKHSCQGDSDLYDELARLLKADSEVQRAEPLEASRPPRFGPYQARERIGAGGMGAVYRATREDGELRQQVAVKVMASVLWSAALDERFRRERQMLAELQHPHIARFLDGGMSDEGLPYLAMEYVDGERIDAWCRRRRLPLRDRIELFLKVCDAVSFAHHKLIVHRDLKPANILVTAEGDPKLLDFGIARTLEPDAEAARATLTGGLFFTPHYASPELLRGQAAGVACDVYSLGVLLYELLSGKLPLAASETNPGAIIETVLAISPVPVSAAFPDTSEAAAALGRDSAAAIRRKLRGDLDAIVGKSLEKSPADRYASVEQFAGDLRRYLAGHPVQARAASPWVRARKFVLRHKAGVGAGALVAAALALGAAGTLWQAHVARQQRAAAERRFNQARELARYLVFDLQSSVEKLPGSTPLRAEMVERSLTYLDRLSAEKTNDEALRTEVARGYMVLADVMGNPLRPNLGQPVKARDSYRKAIAILEPIAGRSPENRDARVFLARSRLMLGRGIGFSAESPEGRKLVESAAAEFGRLAAKWPADFQVRSQAGIAYDSLARSLSQQGGFMSADNIEPALAAERQAVEHARAALALKPGDLETIRQLTASYKVLGDIMELRDRPAATPFYRQALAAVDRIAPADRETPTARGARCTVLLGLGWNLGNLGFYPEAIQDLEEARRIRDRLSEEDPRNIMALTFRITPYRNLAIIHQMAGQTVASLENFLGAIAVYDRLVALSPTNPSYRFARAELQSSAANVSIQLGRAAEGQRLAAAAEPALKEAAQRPDANPVELAIAARSLLECAAPSLRDYPLALAFAKRADEKGGKDAEIQEILGEAYWLNGDRTHAVEAIERSLTLIEKGPTPARQSLEKTLGRYRTTLLPAPSRR